MQEKGTVAEVMGNRATVRIRHVRGPACQGCTACRPFGGGTFALEVEAEGLAPGDEVVIDVPTPSPWRAVVLLFGTPLAALVGGLVAGASWTRLQGWLGFGPEGTGLALGTVLGIAAFVAAAIEDRRFRNRHRPSVIQVVRDA